MQVLQNTSFPGDCKMSEETSAEFLLRLGTDGQKWAKEFVKIVKEKPSIATDEGTMIGWFANAIMAGYDKAQQEKKKDFEFSCTNHECRCRNEGIGLAFTTDDIEEAEEHSRENNSPMWVSRKDDHTDRDAGSNPAGSPSGLP